MAREECLPPGPFKTLPEISENQSDICVTSLYEKWRFVCVLLKLDEM